MTRPTEPVVLAVDDDEDVLETYELWLDSDFEVRTASGGRAALDRLDTEVDVVLLDRMMPGLTGDEVLERIADRSTDPQVVMLTALDPGFDIAEMEFDAYVTKPVTRESLLSTIDTVLKRTQYAEQLRTYHSLVERRAVLQTTKEESALAENERYQFLLDRIETLESDLGALVSDIDHDDFVALTQTLAEHENRRLRTQ